MLTDRAQQLVEEIIEWRLNPLGDLDTPESTVEAAKAQGLSPLEIASILILAYPVDAPLPQPKSRMRLSANHSAGR